MKRIHHLLVIGMLLLVVACQKDKSESARMNLLTTGTWKLIALDANPGHDVDGNGFLDRDLFAFYELCEKDNLYVFKSNGVYEINEGATKCDASDPQVYTSNWKFTNNETEIIVDGDLGTIEELTTSIFVMRAEVPGQTTSEADQTYTFTFGR